MRAIRSQISVLQKVKRTCPKPSIPTKLTKRTFVTECLQTLAIIPHYLLAIPQTIQSGIIVAHETSGMPWWATLAASTAVVRLMVFPFIRLQMIASKGMGKAVPDIVKLHGLYKERLKESIQSHSGLKEQLTVNRTFFKGVSSALAYHEASKLQLVMYPLLNAATFITFV